MDTARLTADQIERHLAEADHRQTASADGCRAPYPTADAVGAPSPCR